MMEWKKICCAVDFSQPSRVALEGAADLARRFQAELTLVHAVSAPAPAASDILVSSAGMAELAAEEEGHALEAWRSEAEQRVGAPVHASLVSGDPAAAIVQYARDQRCDLLVIGTHGRGGIRRVMLGSVAERAVRRAECPVLVIGERARVGKGEVDAEELSQYA
jgi:universal stress protein A